MADCTKEFNQLLTKIDLSKTKIENLKRGRDALREKIKNYYKDNNKTLPDFCDLAIYGIWQEKIYLARRGYAQWEENDPKLFTDWFY